MSDRINGSANLWTLSTGQLPEKNFQYFRNFLERACNSPLPQMEISFIFGWTIIVYCNVYRGDRINGSANLWTLSTGQLTEKNFSNVFGTMLFQFLNALVTAPRKKLEISFIFGWTMIVYCIVYRVKNKDLLSNILWHIDLIESH